MKATKTHPLLIDGSGPPGLKILSHRVNLLPPHEFTIAVQCDNGMSGLLELLSAKGCNELRLLSLTDHEIVLNDVTFEKGDSSRFDVEFNGWAQTARVEQPTKGKPTMEPKDAQLTTLLLQLAKRGVFIKTGPHKNGLYGYFARISRHTSGDDWETSGHGFTLEEAVQEAIALFNGKITKTQHKSEDFLPQCDIVHGWFGLSYAQYLTIPRTALQSMPADWQERFVECLNELDATIDWRPKEGTYRVQLMKEGVCSETGFGTWDHEIPDPLMDYQRGRRRVPHKARLEATRD